MSFPFLDEKELNSSKKTGCFKKFNDLTGWNCFNEQQRAIKRFHSVETI